VVTFRLFGEKPPLHRLKPKFAWWVMMIHSGVTILQRVEFPIFLLIFAWRVVLPCDRRYRPLSNPANVSLNGYGWQTNLMADNLHCRGI